MLAPKPSIRFIRLSKLMTVARNYMYLAHVAHAAIRKHRLAS